MRLFLLIVIFVMLQACSKPEIEKKTQVRPIAWKQVAASPLEQIRTLSGIVAPVEAAKLSFEVYGKVDHVFVNLGDKVVQGQELAKLNELSFNLSLQSAEAQLNQARASHREAKNEFERYRKLSQQGLVSQSGFDNSKAAFDSTKSAVAVAQAQLEIAQKNLADSHLVAPYNGIITKRLIEPSQQVATGQAVFEIEGDHGLEVRLMVPETLIRELKPQTQLNVHFPVLPNLTIAGTITEIGTRAESANAFPLTVVLNQPHSELRAGMTAEVDFTYEGMGRTGFKGLSVKVPVDALGADLDQKAFVFVFEKDTGTVKKRYVQTENVFNNQVFISKGLTEGEIVAVAGVAFLRDGQPVTLLDKHTQRFN